MKKTCCNCHFGKISMCDFPCNKCGEDCNKWFPEDDLKDFAIDELVRLKAKMLEEQKPYHCLFDDEYCRIIDKRISELKGE